MSDQKPTVVEAIASVMDDVRAVSKDGRNVSQNFNFRGIDAVMNAVGPAFRRHGVVCIPRVTDHSLTTRGKMNFCSVRVVYTFHGPAGDTLPGESVGEAFDAGDKATAKAMSVAYRTFLLQALTLPTDEPDPDMFVYDQPRVPAITVAAAEAHLKTIAGDFDAIRTYWQEAAESGSTPDVLDLITAAGNAAREVKA